ncbi:NAD-dependent epimerase/dehydratase family protein [Microbispora sp. NPDC049125]|uniref:NAD-dependent epimerase/dehydratase family protein n=1 Tax=Microbispora sp. NPDC049125 TaxID=3154929 RepID=UPI003465DB59
MNAGEGDAILVAGGTGFIGSAVVRLLLAATDRPVRVLRRGALPEWMAGATLTRGDLADPRSLRGSCDGVSTLIHLASQIAGDAELCDRVNFGGTAALLAEARSAGVRRTRYLSTTSVYGMGTHRGDAESALVPHPVSPTSMSRAAAERLVLAAGGTVLRPHLVYGPGDKWFVPALLRLFHLVPAWIDGGRALMTLVSVGDLARVVGALALEAGSDGAGVVLHVGHPEPVSVRRLLTTVHGCLGLPLPELDLPAADHRALSRTAVPAMTDHQFTLLADDHWYDTSAVWSRTALDPGPGFEARFPAAVSWYRELLSPTTKVG